MILYCDRCGQDAFDHTARELQSMECEQVLDVVQSESWTATEYGLVNPEASEDTGEEFNLCKFEGILRDRLPRRLVDAADRAEDWRP